MQCREADEEDIQTLRQSLSNFRDITAFFLDVQDTIVKDRLSKTDINKGKAAKLSKTAAARNRKPTKYQPRRGKCGKG